jgi:hypothetical protein
MQQALVGDVWSKENLYTTMCHSYLPRERCVPVLPTSRAVLEVISTMKTDLASSSFSNTDQIFIGGPGPLMTTARCSTCHGHLLEMEERYSGQKELFSTFIEAQ